MARSKEYEKKRKQDVADILLIRCVSLVRQFFGAANLEDIIFIMIIEKRIASRV